MESEDHTLLPPDASLEAIPQPAFHYGAHHRVIGANGPAEALAGRPLAGAYAAAVAGIFDIRQPDGTPAVLSELPAIRALAGEEVADVPYTITAADGRSVQIRVSAFPIREGDTVVGAISVWYEIPAQDARPAGEGSTVVKR